MPNIRVVKTSSGRGKQIPIGHSWTKILLNIRLIVEVIATTEEVNTNISSDFIMWGDSKLCRQIETSMEAIYQYRFLLDEPPHS